MLTLQQLLGRILPRKHKRTTVRTLIKAYYANRDLSLAEVCKANNIRLRHKSGNTFDGEAQPHWGEDDVAHYIILPQRSQQAEYREFVFWHEFAHILLRKLRIFQDSCLDWLEERLCEAFASLLMLYRHGVLVEVRSVEEFLFANVLSLGRDPGEIALFELKRMEAYCKATEESSRNIDTSKLRTMLVIQWKFVGSSAQLRLPMDMPNRHQTAFALYSASREPIEDLFREEKGVQDAATQGKLPL